MADDTGTIPLPHDFAERIERAADALRLHAEGRAKEQVELVSPPDWRDVIDFFESLMGESDRAIPVLGFSFIDGEMLRLMKAALNPDVHPGVSALFGAQGPLATSSSRIDLAHALYWITSDTAYDLHILRRIRNRYAHTRVREGFKDDATVALLARHRAMPSVMEAVLEADYPVFDGDQYWVEPSLISATRAKLVVASALTAWRCLGELYVAPVSMRTGVSPHALLDWKSPSAPQGILDQGKAFGVLLTMLLIDVIEPLWLPGRLAAEMRAEMLAAKRVDKPEGESRTSEEE